jgi:hypothetical protein
MRSFFYASVLACAAAAALTVGDRAARAHEYPCDPV